MKRHIIFDLDGTLIDSAPSILESFSHAFSALGITPHIPITPDVVGPPLMQTLTKIAGQDDPVLLQSLSEQFKAHYDAAGYQKATVYTGVPNLLEMLKEAGLPVYIATNKRDLPTQKLMVHLNWAHYFKGVFALDSYTPSVASKPLMIQRILADYEINPQDAIYIGDRFEDGLAADYNHLDFAMVTWGYADKTATTLNPNWLACKNVVELQNLLVC